MRCFFCGIEYSERNEGECCGKSLTGAHYPFIRYDALVRAGEEAAQKTASMYRYLRDNAKLVKTR